MSILVLKAGILDSFQDLGRYGYSHWGINPGGCMDTYAASIANALVGNGAQEAVMELHFPAPQLLFEQTTLISICGADFCPKLNGEAVPLWQPLLIRKNTVLYFEQPRWGMRCYIAVHGGYAIPKWLGSYGTNLKAGAGGFEGRKLGKSDHIPLRLLPVQMASRLKDGEDCTRLNWKALPQGFYTVADPLIEILEGHEWGRLTDSSRERLVQEPFQLELAADRMGFPLKGPELSAGLSPEMISCGVAAGSMQLLPGGKLIILMADHQTTGGYPQIGHVVTAQLPRLAQMRPGSPFRFRITNSRSAEMQLVKQKQDLAVLIRNCQENIRKWTQSI